MLRRHEIGEQPREAELGGNPVAQLLHGDGTQRRGGGGLPDHRVAADGADKRIPGPHGHREVERRDRADYAQGVPLFTHAVLGPLGGHGAPVQHARLADGEVGNIDHLLDLAVALLFDLAGLQGYQAAQGILVFPQDIGNTADHLPALWRRENAPACERFGAGLDQPGVVPGAAAAHRGDGLTGSGIDAGG